MQVRNEITHSINGVSGRLFALNVPPAPWVAGVFANQTWISEGRKVPSYEKGAVMHVELQFDDNCKNGHMRFAITADIVNPTSRNRDKTIACGCLHGEIEKYFPELAPLIKWHLTSTDGPMYYIANTVYLAGNRDCSGKEAGEPSAFEYGYKFNGSPVTARVKSGLFDWIEARRAFNASTPKSNPEHGEFRVCAIAHKDRPGETYKFAPKFTFVGYGEQWHDCPFDDEHAAQEFALALNTCTVTPVKTAVRFSDGKARQLDAARVAAAWPDATDEQLSASKEELTAALTARLPGLLDEFKSTMESIGFLWAAPTV